MIAAVGGVVGTGTIAAAALGEAPAGAQMEMGAGLIRCPRVGHLPCKHPETPGRLPDIPEIVQKRQLQDRKEDLKMFGELAELMTGSPGTIPGPARQLRRL